MICAFDDYELDVPRLELRRAGVLVKADPLVLRLLAELVQNAGSLVTKNELIDAVWDGRVAADNVLTVAMARLRRTLGQENRAHELIATEYGRGYRFVGKVAQRARDSTLPGAPSAADALLDRTRQRIASLDFETRAVLDAAAVIGPRFSLRTLTEVLADADAAEQASGPRSVMASLDDAIASDVISASHGSLPEHAFEFRDELLRTQLCAETDPEALQHMHLRVGATLHARRQAGEAIPASELAQHYHAALPLEPRLAVQYCRDASAEAAKAFASLDVIRYLRQGLEALEHVPSPSPRLRLQMLFGLALYARVHASAEHVRALHQTVALAQQLGDGAGLVNAARMLMHLPGQKPTAGAREALERALPLLDPNDVGHRAIGLATLACSAPAAFDVDRSGPLIEEAAELAQKSNRPDVLHPVLRCQLYLQGGPAHARSNESLERALSRLAHEHPGVAPVLPVELALYRANVALQRGALPAVSDALADAADACRLLRGGELLWHCERYRALDQIRSGNVEEGRAALHALHRRAERRALLHTETLRAIDCALVFEDLTPAHPDFDKLRALLAPDASEPPSVWALKTDALASAGFLDEARAALSVVPPERLAKLPLDTEHLGTLGHLARVTVRLHLREYASALHAELSGYEGCVAGHLASAQERPVAELLVALASVSSAVLS